MLDAPIHTFAVFPLFVCLTVVNVHPTTSVGDDTRSHHYVAVKYPGALRLFYLTLNQNACL